MRRPTMSPSNARRVAYALAFGTAMTAELSAIRTKELDDTITWIVRSVTPTGSLKWFVAWGMLGWSGWHLLVENR